MLAEAGHGRGVGVCGWRRGWERSLSGGFREMLEPLPEELTKWTVEWFLLHVRFIRAVDGDVRSGQSTAAKRTELRSGSKPVRRHPPMDSARGDQDGLSHRRDRGHSVRPTRRSLEAAPGVSNTDQLLEKAASIGRAQGAWPRDRYREKRILTFVNLADLMRGSRGSGKQFAEPPEEAGGDRFKELPHPEGRQPQRRPWRPPRREEAGESVPLGSQIRGLPSKPPRRWTLRHPLTGVGPGQKKGTPGRRFSPGSLFVSTVRRAQGPQVSPAAIHRGTTGASYSRSRATRAVRSPPA